MGQCGRQCKQSVHGNQQPAVQQLSVRLSYGLIHVKLRKCMQETNKEEKPEKPVCQNHPRQNLLVYIAKVCGHMQIPDSTRVRFRKAAAATAYNCDNLEQPHVHDEGWSYSPMCHIRAHTLSNEQDTSPVQCGQHSMIHDQ